jgi:hypothetical protein
MALSGWAADYVKLVLAVGRHDADFVEAYYGPEAWKAVAEVGHPRPLVALASEAQRLQRGIAACAVPVDAALRRDHLLG